MFSVPVLPKHSSALSTKQCFSEKKNQEQASWPFSLRALLLNSVVELGGGQGQIAALGSHTWI